MPLALSLPVFIYIGGSGQQQLFANTPFTLQAVSPVVTHVWRTVPILRAPSDAHMNF